MRLDGNNETPLRVVVSGGIGSGKTTVLQKLEDLGAVIIEADRIGHDLLEPGGSSYQAVVERWPSVVVAGRIERRLLAAIVFSDPDQLALLESLTHPAIRNEIANRVDAAGDSDVALELPLSSDLTGSGWTRIVVDAPASLRVRRAVARGMSEEDATNRLAVQPDRTRWLEGADLVVENTGSIKDLEANVEALWQRLKNRPRS